MIGSLLQADFEEIIRSRNWDELREALGELDPPDIAELLVDVAPEVEGIIFRLLPRDRAAQVFEYVPLDRQQSLVDSLNSETVRALLNEMTPDDRTRLLEALPADVTRRLLDSLSAEELKEARKLLGYPEGTAGRYMTPEYVALPPDITAREALARIHTTGRGKETLNVIYLINERGKLLEDLRLGTLVLANPETMIGDIEERQPVFIRATDRVNELIDAFERYDRSALPVVDDQGIMLGIVTHDDVLEFAERRATEEIHRLGGSEALDAPYLTVGFWPLIRKRGGWLAILFLGEMLTATAMGYFESEIERAAVVALFVPLIISSGGNSGSQGTSLIIRALALKEIRLRDWWRVFGRELRTGLALGIILGFIGFCRIGAWQALSHLPHAGKVFQTRGSHELHRIPLGMKYISADTRLESAVKIPAYSLPAGAWINRGTVLPIDTPLPHNVPVTLKSADRLTAYGQYWFRIGLTVFLALIGVVTWGSITGSMLPFILRRLGFDPATSSAPLVATLVDVTGLIIYFVVAKMVLTGTVL
jgi:magnesium transporter